MKKFTILGKIVFTLPYIILFSYGLIILDIIPVKYFFTLKKSTEKTPVLTRYNINNLELIDFSTKVLVDETVLFIPSYYFKCQNQINIVKFYSDDTIIADSAFLDCKHLLVVILPAKLIMINNSTFEGCSRLQEINIPKNVEKIGKYAFKNCKSLKKIVIPESVEEIGKDAFSGCNNIVLAFQTDDERKVKQLLKEANVTENTSIIFQGAKSTVKEFVTKTNN